MVRVVKRNGRLIVRPGIGEFLFDLFSILFLLFLFLFFLLVYIWLAPDGFNIVNFLLFSFPVLIPGIPVFLFLVNHVTKFVSLELSSQLRQVIVTQISLFSNTKTFISFNDIDGIQLLEKENSEGDKFYTLQLQTRSLGPIFLYQFSNKEEVENLARELQAETGLRLDRVQQARS